MAKPFEAKLHRGSHCYNHCPLARPEYMAESKLLALLQVLQNSGSRMIMLKIKTLALLAVRDSHSRNSREKMVEGAAQQDKSACLSTKRLSATQNGRGAAESFSTSGFKLPSLPTHCDSPSLLSNEFALI